MWNSLLRNPVANLVVGFVVGAIVGGVLGNTAYDLLKRWAANPVRRWIRRLRRWTSRWLSRRRGAYGDLDCFGFDQGCQIVRFSGTSGFKFKCTESTLDSALPAELDGFRRTVMENAHRRGWTNQQAYALISVGSRSETSDVEPLLELTVGRTDYYTFQATNMKLNEKIPMSGKLVREEFRFVDESRPPIQPVAPFANCLSVNLVLVTDDDHMVIARRGSEQSGIGMYANRLSISVGETLSYGREPFDSNGEFLKRGMIRGAKEELNLELGEKDIEFYALQFSREFAQWGLLAFAKVRQSLEELKTAGPATTHRWENSALLSVPFSPKQTARSLKKLGPKREDWVPGTLTAICLALIHAYPNQDRQIVRGLDRSFA